MLQTPVESGVQWDVEPRVSEILILLVYRRIIRYQVSLSSVTLEDCWSVG